MRRRPNILWICTDQQRYDTIGCLNNRHIDTPVLDRLCAEGVAFSRTYCQSPVCQPSRASFLSGLYPNTVHVNRNGNSYFPANERVRLITRRLADVGYDCGLAGKLHLASAWTGVEARADDGYRVFDYSVSATQFVGRGNAYSAWLQETGRLDEVLDTSVVDDARNRGARYRPDVPAELHQTAWCADRAIDFMRERRSGPWLMSVNIFDPHGPFDAPLSYQRPYDERALPPAIYTERDAATQERLQDAFFQSEPQPPGERQRQQKASYYGMVTLIDQQVGRMLEALEAAGQRDDTVVIFTSDHGEMLGDHGLTGKGCRFYEGRGAGAADRVVARSVPGWVGGGRLGGAHRPGAHAGRAGGCGAGLDPRPLPGADPHRGRRSGPAPPVRALRVLRRSQHVPAAGAAAPHVMLGDHVPGRTLQAGELPRCGIWRAVRSGGRSAGDRQPLGAAGRRPRYGPPSPSAASMPPWRRATPGPLRSGASRRPPP